MLAAAAFALLSLAEPVDRRPPVDECAADPSFVEFRERLRAATDRRDIDYLLSVIGDDIHASFGGHRGRADFIELWSLDRPGESEVWTALAETLRLGCKVSEDGTYVAPAFFLQTREGDEAYDTYLAVSPGAPLRTAPRRDAAVLASLEWDVLTWLNESEGWYEMRLADGRRGFVEAAHVRSLVDYRAFFERIDGRWRMTVFIAGD